MASRGDSIKSTSVYAGYSLAFYLTWVVVGIVSSLSGGSQKLFAIEVRHVPVAAVLIAAFFVATQILASRATCAKKTIELKMCERYRRVSYIRVVASGALLLLPLPLMLAVARDSFFMTIGAVLAHLTYVYILGRLMLNRVKIAGN
jgi:hypothetical protein